jgi:FkbM family methyltransferase
MLSLRGFGKPQYLFRPRQIVRRLLQEARSQSAGGDVLLPWGLRITLDPQDTVSEALFRQGIYDIVTTEMLWRLTGRGDCAVDIGANIGYVTSLFASRCDASGTVFAFEPHPATFEILQRNVQTWSGTRRCARITPVQFALSNVDGTALLAIPFRGDSNASHACISPEPHGGGIPVSRMRFDSYFATPREFGVVKIDSEGHEASIFEGMAGHLRAGRVRDIVYEETSGYPAASHDVLERFGYSILAFEERLTGPMLIAPSEPPRMKRPYDILPSYLATLDPARVQRIFANKGWYSLAAT